MATLSKYGSFFYHSLLVTYKNHNKESPMTKFEPLFKCSFREIRNQRLTASPYTWN